MAVIAASVGIGSAVNAAVSKEMRDGTAWSKIELKLSEMRQDGFDVSGLLLLSIAVVTIVVAALAAGSLMSTLKLQAYEFRARNVVVGLFSVGLVASELSLFRLPQNERFKGRALYVFRASFAGAIVSSLAYVAGILVAGENYAVWLTLGSVLLLASWLLVTTASGISRAVTRGESWIGTRGGRATCAGVLGWLLGVAIWLFMFAYQKANRRSHRVRDCRIARAVFAPWRGRNVGRVSVAAEGHQVWHAIRDASRNRNRREKTCSGNMRCVRRRLRTLVCLARAVWRIPRLPPLARPPPRRGIPVCR